MVGRVGQRRADTDRVPPLTRLALVVFPPQQKPVAAIEAGGLLVVATAVAFLRLGQAAWNGTMWAEDGGVFLQDALNRGGLHSVPDTYAGYLLVVPRLIAAVVVLLPLAWQGVATNLAAALVQAAIGVLVYVAAEGRVAARWARLLVLASVVAVPVAPEVIDSIANLQWFLLFGAAVSLLWIPITRNGWLAAGTAVLAATTTSPFAVLLLIMAIVRLILQRNRPAFALAVVAAVGFVFQTIAMIAAPRRATTHTVHPLVRGFVRRVLGDGVLGVARLNPAKPAASITAGLVVIVVMVGLSAFLLVRHRYEPVVGAAILGVLSYVFFLAPTDLGAVDTDTAFNGARYFVAPALFISLAIAILAGNVVEVATWRAPSWGAAVALVAVGLVAACIYGLVTSWSPNQDYGRRETAGWSAALAHARTTCRAPNAPSHVAVPIAPESWHVIVSCGRVRNS